MADYKFYSECFLCQRRYQFGPHRYDGRYFRDWNIEVCDWCVSANVDGIVLESHPRLVQHLKAKGIEIHLNRNGWLYFPDRHSIPFGLR